MQPYQQTDAYRRSQKLDPVTQAPVWPLRLIEQRRAGESLRANIDTIGSTHG